VVVSTVVYKQECENGFLVKKALDTFKSDDKFNAFVNGRGLELLFGASPV